MASSPKSSAESETSSTKERSRRKNKKPKKRVEKEIRHLRRTAKLCIPKLPFSRLVRAIQQKISPETKFWQSSAIACLQEAAEAFLVQFFEDAYSITQVSRRQTLMPRDLHCVERIYSKNGVMHNHV